MRSHILKSKGILRLKSCVQKMVFLKKKAQNYCEVLVKASILCIIIFLEKLYCKLWGGKLKKNMGLEKVKKVFPVRGWKWSINYVSFTKEIKPC